MKKAIALIFAMVMVLSLVACGSQQSATGTTGAAVEKDTTQAAKSDETQAEATTPASDANVVVSGGGEQVADEDMFESITMAVSDDCLTLDPFQGGGKYYLDVFYQRLGMVEERGKSATLTIGKEMKKVSDLVYEVEIWDNVEDTAGNKMTAEDVAYCYNTCRALAKFNRLKTLEEVEVVDDYTVRFTFTTLNVGDLDTILMEVPLVTKAAYEGSADKMATEAIGTTGYVCKELIPGTSLTAEYSGKCWQDADKIPFVYRHNVKEIKFVYIPESSQACIALQTGSADISNAISTTDLYNFQDGGEYADKYDVFADLDSKQYFIEFNCSENSICNNLDLRKAICYAIDPEMINDITFNGEGEISYTVGSVQASDVNPAWKSEGYYDYSVDDAKAALAASGLSNVTVTLLTSSKKDFQSVSQVIQANLEEIGIKCELATYQADIIEDIMAEADAWDFYIDSKAGDDYLVNAWIKWGLASAWGGHTRGFVEDEEFQKLLADCRAEATHSQELTDQTHEYIKDNAYAYGLLQTYIYSVYNSEKITELAVNRKLAPVPGACTYVID